MIKIVLHCLPNELDQVTWIIDQLKRSSRFIDPSNFILDFAAGIQGVIDQRLASLGFDDKGALAGLSELLSDRARIFELQEGETKRTFAQEGKPVLYRGEEYIVDSYGRVYSEKSNILLEGIIPENEYKEIQKRASKVTEEVINMTGGTFITGAANQAVQLIGLIRSGGAIKKSLGLKGPMAGNIGMGISSFTSGVVNNVDDIRSQLMATGMSEKEAMTIAVNAGQAISSLDGVFSALAGSNEKLLSAAQGIKQNIVKLAVTKGKDFTRKEFVQKAKEMGLETLKEQAEELSVLKAEKVINALVNDSIGKEVLDTETTKSEYYETVLMTLGVTTTLGTARLMSGLDRSQLVRTLAKNVNDLEKPLKELVKEGSLTKEQAAKTYAEVYSMQAAELKTKGTIIMPDNVEEAADLLTQRQNLKAQREGLEGPLKEDIDKRIKDVDEQIKALQVRDKAEYEKVKAEEAPVAEAEVETEVEVAEEVQESDVSPEVEAEIEIETEEDILSALDELKVEVEAEQKGSLMDNIDKKVRIDGKDGVIKIDDENENTIVVETDDGQIIELGRKDEIGDNTLGSENISIIPSESEEFLSELDDMKVSEEESSKPDDVVTIDGVDVKVIGRRRDKKGKAVVRVKEVESGLERRIIGEQAEVILKDESLRKEKKPEKLKLTVEGKEKPRAKRKKKSKKKAKEEFDNKTLEELESMEKQLEEDTKAFEEMALEEAAAKATNQDIVQVGGNIYQVTKKKDGSYTVRTEERRVGKECRSRWGGDTQRQTEA